MKKYLPNLFTLLNLASGSIGAIIALRGNLYYGALCIRLGACFDFLDGFSARVLRMPSPFGKQLDSLADLVTFGFLPTVIMYSLIESQTVNTHLPYFALLITLFSALRLAKFNLDTRQHSSFSGLPTPANAIFISTLPFMITSDQHPMLTTLLSHHYTLIGLCIVSASLLVVNMPFIAFKMTNYTWQANRTNYSFLAIILLLTLVFRTEGIALGFVLYILLSSCSLFYKKNPKDIP
jgi:CDP-diacylglycerol--serine O-phosphatidyltransferase